MCPIHLHPLKDCWSDRIQIRTGSEFFLYTGSEYRILQIYSYQDPKLLGHSSLYNQTYPMSRIQLCENINMTLLVLNPLKTGGGAGRGCQCPCPNGDLPLTKKIVGQPLIIFDFTNFLTPLEKNCFGSLFGRHLNPSFVF